MSGSNSDIGNAASASTSTFTTALVFNAAVFGAQLAIFTIVRPYFPAIYQPRTYIPPEGKRIAPLTHHLHFLTWPIAIFRADYRDIKKYNGLDAYFFVRFLRMVVRMLLPIWLISWLVLLPLVSVGTGVQGRTGLDRLTFGNISRSGHDQVRYAGHLICAWLLTFWVWYNIKREMSHFIVTRQRWLIDPSYATSAQASTVLITGVPQRYLTEVSLTKLFEVLPGGVKKIWLNRDLKEMPDLYERRLKACDKLESAETNLLNTATKLRNKNVKQKAKAAKRDIKTADNKGHANDQTRPSDASIRPLTQPSVIDTEAANSHDERVWMADTLVPKNKRPTHRLPPWSWLPFSLPLIGKKVDSIEWARKEIVETSAALKEARITLAKDVARSSRVPPPETNHPDSLTRGGPAYTGQTYPPLNSAFVLFNRQIAAHLAGQSLVHHEPYRMAERYIGVSPEDVLWDNLNMNPYEARVRMGISWAITVGLIILWAFPVAFVGAVSNVHALCTTYKWLAWLCKLPNPIVGIISGILPPVGLAILMLILPIILRLLSRFEGTPTRTRIELSLMSRYFLFQILHSFLIVTLSSGIVAALPDLLKNPGSIPNLLAQNLPKASNFFLTYVILQGLSGTAAGFLQVVALVLYYVKLFILGSTPRSVYGIKYTGRTVAWGTLFPATTLLVVICLAYSIISPVINGLACATFFLFYHLWKYLFLWQLDQPPSSDSGGLFFPKAMQHIFAGLYIQQICLAALFFLAQDENNHPSAVPEGALMVVLIVFTAFFHMIINQSYGPLINTLPLSLADKTHGVDENREQAEREIRDEEQESVKDDTRRVETTAPPPTTRSRNNSIATFDSAKGKAKAPSVDDAERGTNSSPNSPVPLDDIKPVDEDAGPKEFYHPASVEPQRVIWLPRDELGLADDERQKIADDGIQVSLEAARMDAKGHVDIEGSPPGGEVRIL